jgi:drug/metabolite transporter (DMT)-like permease
MLALVGVLGAAGAFTSIRWIGNRAHPLLSVNYFSVFCAVISLFALTATPIVFPNSDLKFALPKDGRQWSMLLFLGVCGFVMQYLLTKGLAAGSRGSGARATNMIYTNMLFALCLDRLVFGVVPSWWSLTGSVLILGSAIYVAVTKQKIEGGVNDENGGDLEEGFDRGRGTAEEEMSMLSAGQELEEEVDVSLREDAGQGR